MNLLQSKVYYIHTYILIELYDVYNKEDNLVRIRTEGTKSPFLLEIFSTIN